MNSKVVITIIIVLLLLIGSSFFVKINLFPPSDTRIILERTHWTYIAPPCFEQAQTTNNLAESTLRKAKELNYRAESSCTEKYLQ